MAEDLIFGEALASSTEWALAPDGRGDGYDRYYGSHFDDACDNPWDYFHDIHADPDDYDDYGRIWSNGYGYGSDFMGCYGIAAAYGVGENGYGYGTAYGNGRGDGYGFGSNSAYGDFAENQVEKP